MTKMNGWHEKNIGILPRHDHIKFPQLVGDRVLYAYHRNEWFATFGDWRSRGWHDIVHLSIADGQPLVIAQGQDRRLRVQWDGITGDAYAEIPCAHVSNGHLYHPAKLPSGRWCIVTDHERADNTYAKIFGMSVFDDHVSFVVDDGQTQYVVDNGQRSASWDAIWDFQSLDGKHLFAAKRGRDVYVVHGDKTVGPWNGVWNLKSFKGMPLYSIMDGTRYEVYFGSCNWRSPAFVQEIACVDDTPFFSVKMDGAWTVIYGNIHEGGYRRVGKLFNSYSKPLYEVFDLEGRVLVHGQDRVTDTCDEILAAKPILGRVSAICKTGDSQQVCFGGEERRSYRMAFGLRQKKHRFEFGAIAGSDILLVTYRF